MSLLLQPSIFHPLFPPRPLVINSHLSWLESEVEPFFHLPQESFSLGLVAIYDVFNTYLGIIFL